MRGTVPGRFVRSLWPASAWGWAALGVVLAVGGVPAAASAQVVSGPIPVAPSRSVPEADVIRFLEQATFGPTDALVSRVRETGFAAWLDEQLDAKTSSYPSLAPFPANQNTGCPEGSDVNCVRDNYSMYPLQVRFFQNAIKGNDQLRQRVAFALHQILVVSGVKVRQPSQMGPYQNLLLSRAFGSYRTLLEEVTLSPAMGFYLDMVNNEAPVPPSNVSPNENYAREVLQLFSVGVNMLNPDGTVQTDRDGDPVPAYGQETIQAFAHVFTGWTYATLPGANPQRRNPANFLSPLWLYRDAQGRDTTHSKVAKQLLVYPGAVHSTLPAGQDGNTDLAQALDNIFHHPNVGPFLGKQLIQHLVTSNPSPAYVARVSRVFDNNGSGVRGDLGAVVTAILLDPEARGEVKTDPGYGRLREPVLFLTNLCRAFNASTDGILQAQTNTMGQNLMYSPTVFNYYPHAFEVPDTGLQGPEFGILTSTTAQARINFVNTLAFSKVNAPAPDPGTALDLSGLRALAATPSALVAELDRLLLHRTMPPAMSQAVLDAVNAVSPTNLLSRAQTAFYLVASSPQYQVAR